MKLTFVTTGDIQNIATSKRAFGMAGPLGHLGYEVSIVAEDTENNRLRIKQEAPTAQVFWFESGLKALEEVRCKRDILFSLKPDFVYISALGARNLAWSPALAKRSNYLIEHSELASAIKNQPRIRRILALALEKASLLLFDGHIVASHYLEEHIGKDIDRYRIKSAVHYSPYAYSSNMLVPNPATSKRLREIAGSRKVLVYMGTLSRNYGILDIIEAFASLLEADPQLVLMVLGKGRDADIAEKMVKQLGLQDHVYLEGYVTDTDMPSYLELANVFIAPLYDTIQDIARCPSKLFLYLPFKRPIVTSAIGEAKKLFGDYDYYFKPGDVKDMTRVLRNALSAAPEWAPPWSIENHSWEQRAQDFDKWVRLFP